MFHHIATRLFCALSFTGCVLAQSPVAASPAITNFLRTPLAFEKDSNESRPRFVARGQGYVIGLDGAKAVIQLPESKERAEHAVSLEFAGSSRAGRAIPSAEMPGKVNYFRGNDPKKWQLGLKTYGRVSYPDAYPGIDVVYYGNQQQLEFDLVVKPGANPGAVRLKVGGADKLTIDDSGALNLGEAAGGLRVALPRIYQEVNGTKKSIQGHYAIVSRDEVAFRVDPWDRTRPLVIDPTIVYSTMFGGGLSYTEPLGIRLDSAGNIILAGITGGSDFPTLNAAQNRLKGTEDVFVTKINAAGTALIYSTYLAGSNFNNGGFLAVDSTGAAWVTGYTQSADFPILNAAQSMYGGGEDAFVARLDSTGALVFSTFLGGSSFDLGQGIAVDSANNGYVIGYTGSSLFPTTGGVIRAANSSGFYNAFVTKYSSTGAVLYSTLLGGGSTYTYGQGIAVDAAGNAYATGYSYEASFPGAPGGGAQTTNNGSGDAFVAKLNPGATSILYFTFLGGTGFDQGKGIAVDASGNAYLTGLTVSAGLSTPGAAQSALAGASDGFIAKLNPSGSTFTYISYLGGTRQETMSGPAVDSAGNVYVTGYTDSNNFPVVSPVQGALPGNGITLMASGNSGATWAAFDSNIPGAVFDASINPGTGSAVVLTEGGIYRTLNHGGSWSFQGGPQGSSSGAHLARSPASPSTIYAAVCCSSVYRSTDDGVTWSFAGSTSVTFFGNSGVVADPLTASTVYLFGGTSPYLFKSTNSGAAWTGAVSGLPPSQITAMTATADGTLYVAISGSGVYKSTNQAGSWAAVNTGLPSSAFYANSLTSSGNTVYIASGTIYQTTNGGATWTPTPAYVGAPIIAVSPQNASILYAFTYNNTVQESSDGGATWNPTGTGFASNVYYYSNNSKLIVDPTNSADVYAILPVNNTGFVAKLNSTGSALLWSTYLGGESFTQPFAIATDGAGNAYAAGYTGGSGFPVTSSALPASSFGAFVTKISDSTAGCAVTLNPGNKVIAPYGTTLYYSVVAPSGCPWIASSNQPWAVITSGASGTGSGTISVQVAYNSSNATQIATLTAGSQSVTITQPSGPACTFTFDKSSYPVTATGGPVSASLTVADGCPWAITNNYPVAVAVTSSLSGTGSATITLNVAQNLAASSRTLSVSVGSTSIQIPQGSGALSVSTTSLPAGAVGTYYAVTLAATGGTSPYNNWTVASGTLPSGLTLNASTGVISGVPTAVVGSLFSFSVTAQDSASNTTPAAALSIAIGASATYPGQSETLYSPRSAAVNPLLFSFASAQAGFDTEITISNTSLDTLGSTAQPGTCALSFYGNGAPSQQTQTSNSIAAGKQLVFMLSQGGGGIAGAPGFTGYIIATCTFPLARGSARLIYNAGLANSVSTAEEAQILTLPRNVPASSNFLIPFVTNQAGFDTGIAIANTSSDPFGGSGAVPTSGTCTLNFYGPGAPAPYVTGSLAAGAITAFTLSGVAPGFQGYVIVHCSFGAAASYAFSSFNLTQNNGYAFSITPEAITLPRDPGVKPLLFPSVINLGGFDTGIVIANTSTDLFGTTPAAGICTLSFYGSGAPNPSTGVPVPSGNLASGQTAAFLLSTVAPGFRGYITVSCPFGYARGLAYILGNLQKNIYTGVPEVVSLPRNTAASSSLLFNSTTNWYTNDTGFVISNTSLDSFGSPAAPGPCTISYFGSMIGGGNPPAPQTSGSIAAGAQLTFLLSQGNPGAGIAGAPGFRGYVIADCGFPLARGVANILGPLEGFLITTASLPGGTAGAAYSQQQLVAANGAGPYHNWIVTAGALPPGLQLNAATGVISGTPATATGSPFAFTVTVQDNANNTSAPRNLSIAIAGPATPVISNGGVLNQADFSAPPLAPGSLAAIFGSSLASGVTAASGIPLQTTLGNVSVSVNGVAAPLLFVSPNQINFQIPYELAAGPVSITVTNAGATSAPVQFSLTAAAPGIFAGATQNAQNSSANTAANPVAPNGFAVVYFTGTGAVNPAVADGAAAPSSQPFATPVAATSVTIGGFSPTSTPFLGLAPGLVGYAQADIQVPAGLLAGSYPVVVIGNGRASAPATIYVSGAAPSVTSVAPNTTPASSPNTAITVNGANFGGGSTVRFTPPNSGPLTITPSLIQAAQIAATIPAAYLTTAGTAQVAVTNGLGVVTSSMPFTITSGTLTTVTPNVATVGTPTAVTLSGSSFAGATTVQFTPPNSGPLTITPTLIQAAQIQATIPASMLTTAGTAQIAISGSFGAITNSLPFTINTASAAPVQPVAAFLDVNGAPALTFNGSTNFPDAGGFLIGAPGVAQAANGDTYIVGLDGAGGVHLNSYSFTNGVWNGWQYSGGILDNGSMQGHVATGLTAAVAPNGVVWFTGRDIGNRYWINSWNGTSFGGWILLDQGILDQSSIPQIAINSSGVVYVVGKDIGGRVWSDSYNPANQTFSGWVDRFGIIVGQPSVTAGQDGLVYVAVRSVLSNSPVYIKQIPANNGPDTTTWLNGGGLIQTDPQITSQGGTVYLTAEAANNTIYLLTFTESNQTYGTWTFTNGILNDDTIAAEGGNVFIAGRDSGGRIYWYSVTGNSWFFAGGAGVTSTVLAGGK